MIIFQKQRAVSWKIAILIGIFTAISALLGGYFSHLFSGVLLKLIFSGMLFISGLIILFPISDGNSKTEKKHFGLIHIKIGTEEYIINLWIALPIAVLTGFGAGMVGVSGGSFLVPLIVLACGVSMHIAVGTASTLIAATAFMGFLGHTIQGDFNPHYAVPLSIITILGGIIGGKLSLKSRPKNLKKIFAYTNFLAALFMIFNAI